MWIILGFLFSLAAFALEPFETLKNVKILRVYPRNVIKINRGVEDGISRNDHIKVSHPTIGYASRAICIKVQGETSYWQLYRLPQAESFSMDYSYTIHGLADREIPFPEAEYRDTVRMIEGLDDEKNAEIKGDLPLDLASESTPKRIKK